LKIIYNLNLEDIREENCCFFESKQISIEKIIKKQPRGNSAATDSAYPYQEGTSIIGIRGYLSKKG